MDHVKPTREELDANINKSLEEMDKLEDEELKPTPSPEPAPEPTPSPEPTDDEDDGKAEDDEEKIEAEEKEEEKKVEADDKKPEDQEVDYQKKFKASTAEAQVLFAKSQKFNEAVAKANALPEPTDDDMKVLYPDWDDMSSFNKQIAKDAFINKRFRDSISQVAQEFEDFKKWQIKVDDFLENPDLATKFPDIRGKEDDFRAFTLKPSRIGNDFDILVPAFLFEVNKNKPNNKGNRMFETGTGGADDKPKPKSDKLSVEESQKLMKTNYPLFRQYLKEGKIEQEAL